MTVARSARHRGTRGRSGAPARLRGAGIGKTVCAGGTFVWRIAALLSAALPLQALLVVSFGSCGGVHDPFSADEAAPHWETRTPIGVALGRDVSVTPDDLLFALTDEGDLRRSLDGGGAWESVDVNGHRVSHVAGGSVLLADTYAGAGSAYSHGGLYRSRDMGSTWETVGFEDHEVTALAAFGSAAYVGVALPGERDQSAALFGTHDGGDSWRKLGRGWQSIRSIAVADRAVFVADSSGSSPQLLRSTDGGDHWSVLMWKGAQKVYCVGIDVLCKVGGGMPLPTLRPPRSTWALSTDLGETWLEPVRLQTEATPLLADGAMYAASGDYVVRWRRALRPVYSGRPGRAAAAVGWLTADTEFPGRNVRAFGASDAYLYVFTADGFVYRCRRPA